MKLLNCVKFDALILSLLIELISATYTKYYISDYCGLLKGSTIKLGENGKPSVALLKLKRETYKPNLDCNVSIKAPPNYGIIAYIKKLKLRKLHQNEDLLRVISDDTNSSLHWNGNNEEISPEINIISNPNKGVIHVIFKSRNFIFSLSSKGFKIVLTIYTLPNSNGKCGVNSSLSFNCANKLCIDNVLECDGINNCANYFDEQNCGATSESTIGVSIFMATLGIMTTVLLIYLCRTKKNREVMARRLSKVYTSGGRRLSTIFSSDGRHSTNPEVLNQCKDNDELNTYSSLPVICHSINDKNIEEEEEKHLNNLSVTPINNQ